MAKARKKPRPPQYEEFIFKLGPPSVSYSFRAQLRAHERDAFWESQMVQITAECLHPERFRGREAALHLLGSRDEMDMASRLREDWKPTAIGWMDAGRSQFQVTVSLPLDACWAVAAAMAAGTITSLMTNGPPLSRGRTTVTSASFDGPSFDPLEYIG